MPTVCHAGAAPGIWLKRDPGLTRAGARTSSILSGRRRFRLVYGGAGPHAESMAGHVSAASALLLLPRPRRLERLEGTWSLPPTLRLACPDQLNARGAIERLEEALRARGHALERTTEPDPAAHVRMRIEPQQFGAALP